MDAVKEAQLEQKLDDLTGRFDRFEVRLEQAEERNREEHHEFRAEINSLRIEQGAEGKAVRTDLGGEIKGVRADLSAEIKAVRTDLGAEISGLRAETVAGFRDLHRLLFLGMTSFIASMIASVAAVLVAHAL